MIRVVVDDLASVAADAVVRPATANLEATTPAVRRLESVAGPAFLAHCRVQEELGIGAAVVTPAGSLAAQYVIHAVISSPQEPVTKSAVRRAVASAMQRSADWQLARVALPPFGIGAGNLSAEEAAEVMVPALRKHLRNAPYPSDVVIVVDSDADRSVFEAHLAREGDP